MLSYCNNNPVNHIDHTGRGLVGLGAQLDVSTGNYECGIEVIVYWDETLRDGGGPVVAVYTYEGASVNISSLLENNAFNNTIQQLSLALMANAGTDYDTMALIELQTMLFGTEISGSVVAIWGYEDIFDSTHDYEGPFTSISGNVKHVKVTWSYCDTCWSIAVGATTQTTSDLSFGQTYYYEVYSFQLSPVGGSSYVYSPNNRTDFSYAHFC